MLLLTVNVNVNENVNFTLKYTCRCRRGCKFINVNMAVTANVGAYVNSMCKLL